MKVWLDFAAQKTDINDENQLKEDLEYLKRQLKATNEELAKYKLAVEKCKLLDKL